MEIHIGIIVESQPQRRHRTEGVCALLGVSVVVSVGLIVKNRLQTGRVVGVGARGYHRLPIHFPARQRDRLRQLHRHGVLDQLILTEQLCLASSRLCRSSARPSRRNYFAAVARTHAGVDRPFGLGRIHFANADETDVGKEGRVTSLPVASCAPVWTCWAGMVVTQTIANNPVIQRCESNGPTCRVCVLPICPISIFLSVSPRCLIS